MTTQVRFGNNLLDSGFVMIPNLLLDYQDELELTDDELLFIIKIFRHHESFKLHDKQIDDKVSSKTLQRRRKSLKEKGYLETTIYKYQDKNGTWVNDGVLYDFSGLILKLTEITPKKNLSPSGHFEEKIGHEVPLNNTNYNTTSYIFKFTEEFEKRYKTKYILSSEEKLLLRNSSEEFKKSIPYIFEYADSYKAMNKLDEEVVPRLIFFLKVPFRQRELISFAQDILFAEELEEQRKQKNAENKVQQSIFLPTIIKKGLNKDTLPLLLKEKGLSNMYYSFDYYTKNEIDLIKPIIEKLPDGYGKKFEGALSGL